MQSATRRQLLGASLLLSIGVLAATLLSPATVVGILESLAGDPAAFGAVLLAVYVARPFLLWPVSSIAIVLGFLYEPVVALPVALVGAAVTGLPPFLIARYADADVGVFASLSDAGRRIVGSVGETRGVLAGRLSPVPGDAVSYGAGLSDVSLGAFVLGTVVGELPWAVVAVTAGASMRTLSVEGFTVPPELVVALAGLAVLLVAAPAYREIVERPAAE